MIYLYQATNAITGIIKVGLTRDTKNGNARIKEYAQRNDLPTEGWETARHYALDTECWDAARHVEMAVHNEYAERGMSIVKGSTGRRVREAFRGTASGVHWTCMRVLKASGLYKPRTK